MALNLGEFKRETNKDKFLNELKNYDIPANNINDLKAFKENYTFRYFMLLLGITNSNQELRNYYKPLYELYLKGYDEND
ncbi:TPA: hypothetical protein PSJ07_002655 [Staphylococcus aureus]|nr:hypothetical protein [Staphylococcus aureus]